MGYSSAPTHGVSLGGIGVSGLAAEEDEALARVGVEALGLREPFPPPHAGVARFWRQ